MIDPIQARLRALVERITAWVDYEWSLRELSALTVDEGRAIKAHAAALAFVIAKEPAELDALCASPLEQVTFATTTVDGNATAAPGTPFNGISTIASGVGSVFDPSAASPLVPAQLLRVLMERDTGCQMRNRTADNPLPCVNNAPGKPRQWCNSCIVRKLLCASPPESPKVRTELWLVAEYEGGGIRGVFMSQRDAEDEIAAICSEHQDLTRDDFIIEVHRVRGVPSTAAVPLVSAQPHELPPFHIDPPTAEEMNELDECSFDEAAAVPLVEARPQEWQPIETAPKDGTRILGRYPNPGIDPLAYEVRPMVFNSGNGKWWLGGAWFIPTHWMPLPAAVPAGAERQQNDQKDDDVLTRGHQQDGSTDSLTATDNEVE